MDKVEQVAITPSPFKVRQESKGISSVYISFNNKFSVFLKEIGLIHY